MSEQPKPHPEHVTRHDLEQFLDGSLGDCRMNELSERLREDSSLRARLGDVARLDAIARVALLATPAPAAARRPMPWLGVVAATCVALAGIALGLRVLPPSRVPAPSPASHAGTSVARESAPLPAMVVFSFPVPARKAPAGAPTEEVATNDAASEPAPLAPAHAEAAALVRRMDAALARGDADGAAALIRNASPELRAAGYRRLGAVLRSVQTAERVLADLPAEARLEACRQLALEPRWRSLATTELVGMHADDELRPAVDALLDDFARSPALAPVADRVRSSISLTRRDDRSL